MRLQESHYLGAEIVFIDRQTAYVGWFFKVDKKKTSVARLNIGLCYLPENSDFSFWVLSSSPSVQIQSGGQLGTPR
jgi:hypothetical protein